MHQQFFSVPSACLVEFPLCGTSFGGFHRVNLERTRPVPPIVTVAGSEVEGARVRPVEFPEGNPIQQGERFLDDEFS